jgi:cell shape-determining protein MreD
MAYCFNTLFIMVFLLFQTSIAPNFRLFYDFFNLMNLFVVYLVFYRPTHEIIVFVGLTGILMDSVSSSPFGLYMTIYIWLSLGIKWTLTYLHKGNMILIPMIISGVILAENLIIIGVMALMEKNLFFSPERFKSIIIQLLLGVLIGPFLIFLIKDLQAKWNFWSFEKIFKYFG